MRTTAVVVVSLAIGVAAAAAPQVVIVRAPSGMVQLIGAAPETDTLVLANTGSDPASVTLVPSGTLFTATPAVFTIDPGAAKTVTIGSNVQSGGFFSGTLAIYVGGVNNPVAIPIRIFAGSQPAGTVAPVRPDDIVISGPAGTPHAGALNISNIGDVTMQGMLASNVPWIVAQGGAQDIVPRGTSHFTFTTDPATREAVAPIGALLARVSMLYLKGTAPGVLQSGDVTVTVADISKVSVVPAEPPQTAPGETIAFLPLVTDTFGFFSDVFFANRGESPVDLKLFYTAIGAPPATSLLANAGPLAAGVAAWFPLAPSSLFSVANQTGTIELRTANPAGVSFSMLRGIIPDGTNRYITAIPVLRSERAIAAGDRLIFAGVEKSPAAHTDILVQETAGFAASYTVDFFDAKGTPVAAGRSGSILPFGSAALPDSVPAGARSARITNTSSGAARLTGFAQVLDSVTSDAWTIVDASRGPAPTSDLVVPVLARQSSSFDLWVTNGSASSAVVTIGATPVPVRRQAVRRSAGGSAPGNPPQSFTLAAGETRQVPLNNAPQPFVHISGPAGALSATGRLTATVPGRLGSFGTGVPAIPASRAAGAGGPVRHFSRADDVPNVMSPTLLLLEVANRPATVRATVAFNFPAGSTVSAHLEASKDYEVAAGSLLPIPDLVRSILGPQRDGLGMLVNVVVDVEVVGGSGRVLPYLQTVDPSGDLTLSVD